MDALLIVGRILVGIAFVLSGMRMLQAFALVRDLLGAKRVPFPAFVTASGIAIEIVLGILAILGVWLVAVAAALAVFVVAATLMVHRFWEEEGAARAQEINVVLSNTVIVGALLAVAALAA